jgi:hypothetical protein
VNEGGCKDDENDLQYQLVGKCSLGRALLIQPESRRRRILD